MKEGSGVTLPDITVSDAAGDTFRESELQPESLTSPDPVLISHRRSMQQFKFESCNLCRCACQICPEAAGSRSEMQGPDCKERLSLESKQFDRILVLSKIEQKAGFLHGIITML